MRKLNNLDMTGLKIINLQAGSALTDAVNKSQLDAAIAGVATTANNGLTKTGNNFRLGGTLTALTTIDAASNILRVSNAQLAVVGATAVAGTGAFQVQNSAGMLLLGTENQGRVWMSGNFDINAIASQNFGGSPLTSFPISRQNAAVFKIPTTSTATAIHIEFQKVLTAAAWDLLVEFKGCTPQNTSNLPNTFSATSYCQMNSTTTLVQQNLGLQNVQQITWYKSLTGKPILKISTFVGLTFGNSNFTMNLYKGGFDEIASISQVVFNTGANI